MKLERRHIMITAMLLFSCVGIEKSCSSGCASSFGGDWIVVQFNTAGEPFNCWKMNGVSITNEEGSDGIWWKNSSSHLVHISGWYNRVQVKGGDWEAAAKAVGVELGKCGEGVYNRKQP
jgi:hypothetical protein